MQLTVHTDCVLTMSEMTACTAISIVITSDSRAALCLCQYQHHKHTHIETTSTDRSSVAALSVAVTLCSLSGAVCVWFSDTTVVFLVVVGFSSCFRGPVRVSDCTDGDVFSCTCMWYLYVFSVLITVPDTHTHTHTHIRVWTTK